MLKRFIIVGIDGFLADNSVREVEGGDWDDYYSLARLDPPFEDMIQAVNGMTMAGLQAIAITERPEKWRSLTTSWLLANRVHVSEVLHRDDMDFGSGPEVKMRLAEARFGSKAGVLEQVSFLIESDEKTIALYQALGLPALLAFPRRTAS